MNRNRWVPVAAIVTVAVLAVLAVIAAVIGVSLRANDRSGSGPPSLGNREAFAFDAAYADADPLVLIVRYGDSGSCPSQAVRQDVLLAGFSVLMLAVAGVFGGGDPTPATIVTPTARGVSDG